MQTPHLTDWLKALFCAALGFVSCWALIKLILRWECGRRAGERGGDFHHGAKPPISRLGGVALVIAFAWIALAIDASGALSTSQRDVLGIIIGSSLAMFTLGLWDDLYRVGAKWKFIIQIAIAVAVYLSDIRIELFKNPLTDTDLALGGLLSFGATVLWLVALTNLINLIDGIDGLAGGISLMLMSLLASFGLGGDTGFSTLIAVGVAGALLGFLRFNYPPAKIYMGDGGAYFLGFLIGILSIVDSNKGAVAAALIAPAFALALPIVDVGLAIFRRALRGLPVFRPDQKHIHHHLITLGFSRERTVLALYMVSLLCLVLAFGVFFLQGRMLPLFIGLLFLVLLIAGHTSGFTKDWSTIGSQLGKSLALRKETRYALTLSQWLVMEVERHQSVDELWQDYQFVVKKLGFSFLELALPDGTKTWRVENFNEQTNDLRHSRHEIGHGTVVALAAEKEVMSNVLFSLLGDLAAEAWYKAAQRWQVMNQTPLQFGSKAMPSEKSAPKRYIRLYSPPKRNFRPLSPRLHSTKEIDLGRAPNEKNVLLTEKPEKKGL